MRGRSWIFLLFCISSAAVLSACSTKPGLGSSTTGSGGTASSTTAGGTGRAAGGTSGAGSTGASTGSALCAPCTELGLVCDAAADSGCGPCTSDADCRRAGAPFPNCQLESPDSGTYGLCVQCTQTAPCLEGSVCNLNGVDDPLLVTSPRTPNVCYPDCRQPSGACPVGGHCDPGTGLCLDGCAPSPDTCVDAGLRCDADSGVCAQCLTSADCPVNQGGCLGGLCGNCAQDSDCPNGQQCDPVHQICVCASNGQCGPLAPDCFVKSGFVVDAAVDGGTPELVCGCRLDAGSCGPSLVCNAGLGPHLGGECLPSCVDGGLNCGLQGLSCNAATGRCGPCTSDAACAGNPQGLVCVADGGLAGTCSCRIGVAASCPSGAVCNPPLGCTPSCVQPDAGCVAPLVCDPATGACRGCLTSADCAQNPEGTTCNNAGDGGTFTCGCASPADCVSPDAGCSSLLGVCGECETPGDCPASNPGCSSLTFSCGSCAQDADCPGALPRCSDGGACGS